MCVNDSGIYILRKAEIIGVDDEVLQSKNVQLDGHELLRIGPEVLE